jgi:hypothetical protein
MRNAGFTMVLRFARPALRCLGALAVSLPDDVRFLDVPEVTLRAKNGGGAAGDDG